MSENSDLAASQTETSEKNGGYSGGIILVVIGAVALLAPYIDWNLLFLPALGVGFLIWGALQREVGLLIPGGILAGIGFGVLANSWLGPGTYRFDSDVDSAAFLLCFAAGWGTITLFSKLFTDETHWWPLIPGGIMAALGAALLAGGTVRAVLLFANTWWPLALVVLGLYLIVKEWRRRHSGDI
jgi:membrane-bound ClpP family serine protease